jgi:hypothetical protein
MQQVNSAELDLLRQEFVVDPGQADPSGGGRSGASPETATPLKRAATLARFSASRTLVRVTKT